jgi:hypothetical protein
MKMLEEVDAMDDCLEVTVKMFSPRSFDLLNCCYLVVNVTHS